MLKRKFKKAYISIEAVILASIVIIGGLAGLSAFLKNGQGAQEQSASAINNTIDMIGEEFGFDFGGGELPGGPGGEEDSGLNEYGFYYEQKYSGYNLNDSHPVFPVGENSMIFHEDGTVGLYSNNVLQLTLTYTCDGTVLNITSFDTAMPVNQGKEIEFTNLGMTLILGDAYIDKEDGLLYVYQPDIMRWGVIANDKTKSEYIIKSEVNGHNITGIFTKSFTNCDNLTTITIPENVTHISAFAFYLSNIESVTYKGNTYTSRSLLEEALKANGVFVDSSAFNYSNLSE